MTDLGNPKGGGGFFVGSLKLNDHGQVVGTIRAIASLPGGFCYLWQAGAAINLPANPAGESVALNNHDQVVGWVLIGAGPVRHAALWTIGEPDEQGEQVAAGPRDALDSAVVNSRAGGGA